MDPATDYLALSEPSKSSHLWRYTPWRRAHPTGVVSEIPQMETVGISLTSLDGGPSPEGVILEKGVPLEINLPEEDVVAGSFLRAISSESKWTLRVEDGLTCDHPVVVDITTEMPSTAIHLSIDVGNLAELELITRVRGPGEWCGLLRTGVIKEGAVVNDIVIGAMKDGNLLRMDSISVGRDAQLRAGTVSSGSKQTKADLRYLMGEPGGDLRVLGSILAVNEMHIDHHIEIHHEAPQTFSRLSWHSACGGASRTIGTGMLRVSEGSKGADAAQIFHNLLLSRDAEADSIPELEVLENEVVGCGHGTANGPIDEDQLFYLETRGLDPSEARSALIAAFLNSTLAEMGSEELHDWLTKLLTSELNVLEA